MSNLAITVRDLDQLDDAAWMREEALDERRRILGRESSRTIMAAENSARLSRPTAHHKPKRKTAFCIVQTNILLV